MIRFGFSTCPNDTYAYHALLSGDVPSHDPELSYELGDVQELNERLARGELDVAKVSFHAALSMAADHVVLPVGSAIGFGVGPVLLAGPDSREGGDPPRVLCPGEQTTATLLYRLFHAGEGRVEQTIFDRILPALERGEADLGVCIHEGRFVYERLGLRLVEDLGERWETETGAPLPLGGILAQADLGDDVLRAVSARLGESLDFAHAHPDATLPTMRRYAQELDDDVIRAHVDLYVNEWTRDLGEVGRKALRVMSLRAAQAGLVPEGTPPLRVLEGAS